MRHYVWFPTVLSSLLSCGCYFELKSAKKVERYEELSSIFRQWHVVKGTAQRSTAHTHTVTNDNPFISAPAKPFLRCSFWKSVVLLEPKPAAAATVAAQMAFQPYSFVPTLEKQWSARSSNNSALHSVGQKMPGEFDFVPVLKAALNLCSDK